MLALVHTSPLTFNVILGLLLCVHLSRGAVRSSVTKDVYCVVLAVSLEFLSGLLLSLLPSRWKVSAYQK